MMAGQGGTSSPDGFYRNIYLQDVSNNYYLELINNQSQSAPKKLNLIIGSSSVTLTINADATISGTNTGDQTFTLTGDASGSGSSSIIVTVNQAAKLTTPRTIAGQTFDGSANISIGFDNLSAHPSTLSGYGITDAASSNIKFKDITEKPSTISEYGITIAVSDVPTLNQSTTGNAATATKLATARNIAGKAFDGTSDIAIGFIDLSAHPSSISGYGITLAASDVPTLNQDTTGNAATASSAAKLTTPRTISGVTFDGTTNIDIPFSGIIGKPTKLDDYGIVDAVKLSGSTMTGALILNGAPTADLQAATKKFVEDTVTNGVTGGIVYKGTKDIVAAPPSSPRYGDLYRVIATGTPNPGYSLPVMTVDAGDYIIFNGNNTWDRLANTNPAVTAANNSITVAGTGDTSFTVALTARTISGVTFDGTTNISIPFDGIVGRPSTIPGYGITIAASDVPTLNQDTTGNAATASSAAKLTTPRTIAGQTFDGSANISIEFTNLSAHPSTLAGYGITDAASSNIKFADITEKPSTLALYGIIDNVVVNTTTVNTDVVVQATGTGSNVKCSAPTGRIELNAAMVAISANAGANIIANVSVTGNLAISGSMTLGSLNANSPTLTNIVNYTESVTDLGTVSSGSTTDINLSSGNIFSLSIPSGSAVTINITGRPASGQASSAILYVDNPNQTSIVWTASNSGNFVWDGGNEPSILKMGVGKYAYRFWWIYNANTNDIVSSCMFKG